MCSIIRVICMCDQCDLAFCALQPKALMKSNWCILLFRCACFYPNTILMQTGWTTVPRPATNLSILICKTPAGIKQSVISVVFKTSQETRFGVCIFKTSLLHWSDGNNDFTSSCPPTFYNKIAPMTVCNVNDLCNGSMPSFKQRRKGRPIWPTQKLIAQWNQLRTNCHVVVFEQQIIFI